MVAQFKQKLCGHMAERRVKQTLAMCPKVKLVTVNRDKLAIVAREFDMSRYETVAEWLASDHKMSWHDATSQVLLDQYYKCDVLVSYKGWHISIDVTTNPDVVSKKQSDIKRMSSAYSKLGIDKQVVLLVTQKIDTETVTIALDNVIRSEGVTIQKI